MLNNNRNKIILGLIVVVLVVVGLFLIFNKGEIEGKDTNNNDVTVQLDLGSDMTVLVVDGKVKVGNKTLEIKNKEVDDITGYYYQPAGSYCLFAKTVDKNVYVLNFDKFEGVGTRTFKKIDIADVDKLSLEEVYVTDDLIGQVDERNRVYAIRANDQIQLDTYCATYNNLD